MALHPHRLAALVAVPAVVLASALALAPAPAAAHAIVVASQPRVNDVWQPGPAEFWVRFNVRIDRARSRLQLIGPDNEEVPLTPGGNPETPPELLIGTAVVDKPGTWVLRWQVLAADGHITRGGIPVTVAAPESRP